MNTNKKFKIIKITVAASVLLVLVVIYYGLYSRIRLLSAQIGGAERSILVLEEKKRDLDSAATMLENFKNEIVSIENIFLSEENFVSFVNTLEDFGRKSGAKFIAKEANFPSDQSSQTVFSFSLGGGFKNIFQFLFLLDNSQYAGVLRKISLRREGSEAPGFIANIDYLIFNFRL